MYAFVAPIDGMELTDPLAYSRSELLGAPHNGSLSQVSSHSNCGSVDATSGITACSFRRVARVPSEKF